MTRNAIPVALSGPHGRALAATRGPFSLITALTLLLLPAPGASAADRPVEGLLVQVPASITTESTGRLRSLLHGPLKRFELGAARQRGQFWLVLDFNPDGQRSECDDFGACLGLARYLRSLPAQTAGVSTVAYVRGDVRLHSVLPVLACTKIEMSAKGRIGHVSTGKPLDNIERTAYEDFARGRFHPLLVRKMYDPNLEVYQDPDKRLFAVGDKLPPGSQLVLEGGQEAALFNAETAKEFGLCAPGPPLNSLDEVRASYNLPRAGVQRHLDRTVCWRIPLEGPITGELVEQTKRR